MQARRLFPVFCSLVAWLLVSACGFAPVYSTSGSSIGPVTVTQIDGRTGYFLKQELERFADLERSTPSSRVLTVKLESKFTSVAVAIDGLSARTLLTLTANYELAQPDSTPPIVGVVSTTISYDSQDQAYSDVALQADAEERGATQIADKIWADLRRQIRSAR